MNPAVDCRPGRGAVGYTKEKQKGQKNGLFHISNLGRSTARPVFFGSKVKLRPLGLSDEESKLDP